MAGTRRQRRPSQSPRGSGGNKISLFRQFGHVGDDHFSIGINGKGSEFHAAMGLCLLPMMSDFIQTRKSIAQKYDFYLKDLPLQYLSLQMFR